MGTEAYIWLQAGQTVLCLIALLFCSLKLRRSGLTWRECPFLLILFGYWPACIASNCFHYVNTDFPARSVMEDGDMLAGTSVLIAAYLLSAVGYLASRRRERPDNSQGIVPDAVRNQGGLIDVAALVLVLGGLVTLAINPYRAGDFGIYDNTSTANLRVGGLLLSGVSLIAASAGITPLILRHPWFGIPCLAAVFLELTRSGSKAQGAVFALYVAMVFWQARRSQMVRQSRKAFAVMLCLFIPWSLSEASKVRFRKSDGNLLAAASTAVGRFTQQEVFSVLAAQDDWRREFRVQYIVDNIASFVPGFLWSGKPINPAYEINRLYAPHGAISAASPSVFGSFLIGGGIAAALFGALLLGRLFASFDRRMVRRPWYLYLEWTYAGMVISVYETTFVPALIQWMIMAALDWMCARATVKSDMQLRPGFVSPAGVSTTP